jgi:hypothetical protein
MTAHLSTLVGSASSVRLMQHVAGRRSGSTDPPPTPVATAVAPPVGLECSHHEAMISAKCLRRHEFSGSLSICDIYQLLREAIMRNNPAHSRMSGAAKANFSLMKRFCCCIGSYRRLYVPSLQGPPALHFRTVPLKRSRQFLLLIRALKIWAVRSLR